MNSPESQTVDLTHFEQPAAAVQDLLSRCLADDRGIHLETAISGLAALGGCLLLRATGTPMTKLKPGAPIFVDAADAAGSAHFNFLVTVCTQLGLDARRGWTDLVPEAHRAHRTVLEMTRALEGPFAELCERFDVPAEDRPRLALYATARLIQAGRDQGLLEQRFGQALALSALAAGSKTVPHPAGPAPLPVWRRLLAKRRAEAARAVDCRFGRLGEHRRPAAG